MEERGVMMKEIQAFLKQFQKEMNWEITDEDYQKSKDSLLHNYLLLTTEVAEVAEEFRGIFNKVAKFVDEENMDVEDAFKVAKDLHRENIGKELADCIAYIVKFANYFEIDLDDSFYSKMNEVKGRENKDPS